MTSAQWSKYKREMVGRALRDERGVIRSVSEYAGKYTLSIAPSLNSEWTASVNIVAASEADGLAANKGMGVTFNGRIRDAQNEGYSYLSIDMEPGATYVLDK